MLKLDFLLAFVTTAEAGSISEAARRLQISKSVASESSAELERNVGATLVHRSTRKLVLTEETVARSWSAQNVSSAKYPRRPRRFLNGAVSWSGR